MEIRLQKFLADAGIASRRKAEELILDGKIMVNGRIVKELGIKIEPDADLVTYRGEAVKASLKKVYIMLHKPEGFVTTVKDQFERAAVTDLVKNIDERLFPVGRLDYDTSGLLLMTNDGDLTYKLTHPKYSVEKTYLAKIFGTPTEKEIRVFSQGVMIEGRLTKPAKMEIVKSEGRFCFALITISEGRNRQIRKMCDEIRHPVASLKRISVGELELGDLEKGKWRSLTDKEISYLKSLEGKAKEGKRASRAPRKPQTETFSESINKSLDKIINKGAGSSSGKGDKNSAKGSSRGVAKGTKSNESNKINKSYKNDNRGKK